MSDETLHGELVGVLADRPAIVFAVLYGSAATESAFNDVAEAYYTFIERTWDEYLDFKPIAMRYLKEMR